MEDFLIFILTPIVVVDIPLLVQIIRAIWSDDRASFYRYLELAAWLNSAWLPFTVIGYWLYPTIVSLVSMNAVASFLISLLVYGVTTLFLVGMMKVVVLFYELRQKLWEIRDRDPHQVRSKLLEVDQAIGSIAYHVRDQQGKVSELTSKIEKLNSASDSLSYRAEEWNQAYEAVKSYATAFKSLNDCIAKLRAKQDEERSLIQSLATNSTQLNNRLEALEKNYAQLVSLLEESPTRIVSKAFRTGRGRGAQNDGRKG
jgi:outer membrane murein-binding lipoprotein Lpp